MLESLKMNPAVSRGVFVLGLVISLAFSGAALAEADIVVTTGKEESGYHTIGMRLADVLSEQNITSEVLTSVGSLENLRRLDDPNNPTNVGLTQADALKYFLKEQPSFADKMVILGEIGKECVFVITSVDSDIKDDGDLQDKKGNLIAVQSPNSGVAVTYEYMTILEPKFKNTAPAFVDGVEALLQVKSGSGKIKAVMIVQRPTAKSAEMQAVLDSTKDFRFVPITDWDLNDKLPDGTAVYTFEDVTVAEKSWGFDTTVDTICTRGLLVAVKDKLDADKRSRLSRIMLLSPRRVVGETN